MATVKLAGSIGVALLVVALGGPVFAQDTDTGDDRKPFVVRTSPTLPGFRIAIDGEVVTTDANGDAHFMHATRENIRERVEAVDTEMVVDTGVRYRFSKVQRFVGGQATAAFNVDYLVDLDYRDLEGNRVTPTAVENLTIKASTGQVEEFDGDQPMWLQGIRVLANNEPREIYWTVQDVTIDGASVVNRAQQRVVPAVEPRLDIELLIYDLEIAVRSRVFGQAQGGAVILTHPDDHQTSHALVDGTVTVEGLPRGEYRVLVDGSGLAVGQPVVVSRDQSVAMSIWTWQDLALIAAGLLAFLAVPIWIGRRARNRPPAATEASESMLSEVGS